LMLEDGPVRAEQVRLVSATAERSMVNITLHEGRNHIVRRMLDSVGHPVRRLSRVAIGPVRLGNLKPGEMRDLDQSELGKLLDLVGR
jgi:23S rRNA pseudouridine2605 synthase